MGDTFFSEMIDAVMNEDKGDIKDYYYDRAHSGNDKEAYKRHNRSHNIPAFKDVDGHVRKMMHNDTGMKKLQDEQLSGNRERREKMHNAVSKYNYPGNHGAGNRHDRKRAAKNESTFFSDMLDDILD